jgi:cephalosporin hydroxylase
MCNLKVLHHNEHGHVVQCANCRHLQIGYGTTVISMDTDEFEKFNNAISESYEEYKNAHFSEFKNITMHTPYKQIRLVFSPRDLMLLQDLLGQAGIMMEVNSLLSSN